MTYYAREQQTLCWWITADIHKENCCFFCFLKTTEQTNCLSLKSRNKNSYTQDSAVEIGNIWRKMSGFGLWSKPLKAGVALPSLSIGLHPTIKPEEEALLAVQWPTITHLHRTNGVSTAKSWNSFQTKLETSQPLWTNCTFTGPCLLGKLLIHSIAITHISTSMEFAFPKLIFSIQTLKCLETKLHQVQPLLCLKALPALMLPTVQSTLAKASASHSLIHFYKSDHFRNVGFYRTHIWEHKTNSTWHFCFVNISAFGKKKNLMKWTVTWLTITVSKVTTGTSISTPTTGKCSQSLDLKLNTDVLNFPSNNIKWTVGWLVSAGLILYSI